VDAMVHLEGELVGVGKVVRDGTENIVDAGCQVGAVRVDVGARHKTVQNGCRCGIETSGRNLVGWEDARIRNKTGTSGTGWQRNQSVWQLSAATRIQNLRK